MDGHNRANLKPGMTVDIVLKADQRTGRLTRGVVARLLTKSPTHPHGIKVMLEDGQVGRVQRILPPGEAHCTAPLFRPAFYPKEGPPGGRPFFILHLNLDSQVQYLG